MRYVVLLVGLFAAAVQAQPSIMSIAKAAGPIPVDGVMPSCTRVKNAPEMQVLYCKRSAMSSRYYQVTVKPGSVVFVPSEIKLDGTGDVLCSSDPFDGADMIVDILGAVVRMYPVPPVPPAW
jgi:hypothetical protein